jgi:hypothetical protein
MPDWSECAYTASTSVERECPMARDTLNADSSEVRPREAPALASGLPCAPARICKRYWSSTTVPSMALGRMDDVIGMLEPEETPRLVVDNTKAHR